MTFPLKHFDMKMPENKAVFSVLYFGCRFSRFTTEGKSGSITVRLRAVMLLQYLSVLLGYPHMLERPMSKITIIRRQDKVIQTSHLVPLVIES